MTFTSLEQRFNQVSKQIYDRFAPSGDQYLVVKPNTNGVFGSKSRVKNDSRALPLVSTLRDIKRVFKFWNSPEGRLFIGKQILLQGANTFAETRLYNINSINSNANTFLGRGSLRHLPIVSTPLTSVQSPLNLSTGTRGYRGGLQEETVIRGSSHVQPLGVEYTSLQMAVDTLRARAQAIRNTFTAPFTIPKRQFLYRGFFLRPEDDSFYPTMIKFKTTESANLFQVELDTGFSTGAKQFFVQDVSQRGTPNTLLKERTNFGLTYRRYAESIHSQLPKSFKQLENTLNTNGYFGGLNLSVLNFDADNVLRTSETVQKRYSTIQDPINLPKPITPEVRNQNKPVDFYWNILGNPTGSVTAYSRDNKPDIITFSFTTNTTGAQPVHFRAFLSSLKQNVKTDYNEQRYIGRTERFVTYGGAKRTATLQFNIAAFSKQEIDQVWTRVNYLTGLAFPLGISNSGFLIPPLFKMTIGGIYDSQPCYIDSLDFDFIDDTTTFDIDEEVTQVINVNMSVTLLEKRSKFYDSRFYAITENLRISPTQDTRTTSQNLTPNI